MKMFPILGRRKQFFTEAQKQIMMERFQANQYLTRREKRELAKSMNMEEKRIAIWYSNMRRKKAAVGMPSRSE